MPEGCDTQAVGDELDHYDSFRFSALPLELTWAITSAPANKSGWTAMPPIAAARPSVVSSSAGVDSRCSAL
jgi:hypothetical protein